MLHPVEKGCVVKFESLGGEIKEICSRQNIKIVKNGFCVQVIVLESCLKNMTASN